MSIEEIKNLIAAYVEEPIINFTINHNMFASNNGRRNFNKTIREKVGEKVGVYIWVDKKRAEIVYIGMAGKIKTNGSLGDHSIQKRLLASRGKDKVSKKD